MCIRDSNCDEEWVVFTGDWPQGGVACAGPRAGVCETISRAGYMASHKQGYCSRCVNASAYRMMFCSGNKQHLGEAHQALTALTWYESLLIARVHPVISVVTLTATGQLCYAGHVWLMLAGLPRSTAMSWRGCAGEAVEQSVKIASAVILCTGLLAESSGISNEVDVLGIMEAFDATMRLFTVLSRGEVAETGVGRSRTPVDALPGGPLEVVSQQRPEY